MPYVDLAFGTSSTVGKAVWLGWNPAHPKIDKVQELEKTLEIESAKQLGPLSTVGWAATSGDAGAAIAAGARLVYVTADPAAEQAIGVAAAALDEPGKAALRVLTSLDPAAGASEEAAVAACTAAAGRLGRPIDVLLLPEAAWPAAAGVLAAEAAAAVGLAVPTAAEAVPALQRVLMSGGAHPAVLVTALHPMVPLVQRMLLGLCRRKGVRVMALDPLGGAEAAETVQTAAAAATGSMLNPELEGSAVFQASAAMLLAWSVAREVIALPAAAEGTPVAEVVALAAAFPPLPLEARAALDTLAPPNGAEVDFGPGRWVPPDHLADRYAVLLTGRNWDRTER